MMKPFLIATILTVLVNFSWAAGQVESAPTQSHGIERGLVFEDGDILPLELREHVVKIIETRCSIDMDEFTYARATVVKQPTPEDQMITSVSYEVSVFIAYKNPYNHNTIKLTIEALNISDKAGENPIIVIIDSQGLCK